MHTQGNGHVANRRSRASRRARSDQWQAAPNDPEREEHFYDALFQELRVSGTVMDLVDETMLDWRKTGRFERQAGHRMILYPTSAGPGRKTTCEMASWHGMSRALAGALEQLAFAERSRRRVAASRV